MDSTTTVTWPDYHQTQTLNTVLPSPYPPPPSTSYPTHYPYYPQNPNPAATVVEPVLNPPGVDSYAPLNSNPVSHLGYEPIPIPNPNLSYGQGHVVDSNSSSLVPPSYGYYYDPNAQNWAAREAVRQYGVDPSAYGAVSWCFFCFFLQSFDL